MPNALVSPDGQAKILPPVHPNLGIEIAYQRKLERLIQRMQNSIVFWLSATYRANKPRLAQDAPPAVEFLNQMRTLGRRWMKQFSVAAEELGTWFATSAISRSDATLKAHLAQAGWTVQFKNTPVVRDVMSATIGAQTALIKSIGQQHLTDVEGLVMRSVQQGGNLKELTDELQKRFNLTRKRAAFIASDQNQKATASITRVRQQELGITKAIWVHSRGGKEPRPEHVAFSGKTFNVATGAYLEGVWTWPGYEPNCKCISRAIIPGLDGEPPAAKAPDPEAPPIFVAPPEVAERPQPTPAITTTTTPATIPATIPTIVPPTPGAPKAPTREFLSDHYREKLPKLANGELDVDKLGNLMQMNSWRVKEILAEVDGPTKIYAAYWAEKLNKHIPIPGYDNKKGWRGSAVLYSKNAELVRAGTEAFNESIQKSVALKEKKIAMAYKATKAFTDGIGAHGVTVVTGLDLKPMKGYAPAGTTTPLNDDHKHATKSIADALAEYPEYNKNIKFLMSEVGDSSAMSMSSPIQTISDKTADRWGQMTLNTRMLSASVDRAMQPSNTGNHYTVGAKYASTIADRDRESVTKALYKSYTMHEMGHAYDFAHGRQPSKDLTEHLSKKFNGDRTAIKDYITNNISPYAASIDRPGKDGWFEATAELFCMHKLGQPMPEGLEFMFQEKKVVGDGIATDERELPEFDIIYTDTFLPPEETEEVTEEQPNGKLK